MQTPVILIAGLLCLYSALGAAVFFLLKSQRGVPLNVVGREPRAPPPP
ncbi:hypothetical protein [Sinomonas atrocyanea]